MRKALLALSVVVCACNGTKPPLVVTPPEKVPPKAIALVKPVELNFQKGVRLNAAGVPIDISVGHMKPAVSDWNGDGKKDLIVGHFAGKGNVKLFINEGTDASPILKKGVALTADGKPIRMDAG